MIERGASSFDFDCTVDGQDQATVKEIVTSDTVPPAKVGLFAAHIVLIES